MIGLILLPFYIFFNILVNIIIIKWLGLFIKTNITNIVKYSLLIIQLSLTLSLYIAIILPNGSIKKILSIVGNYYLGLMIYLNIILLLFFLINQLLKKSNRIHIIEGLITILLITFIGIYGTINSNIIHTTKYEVNINKKSNIKSLKIVISLLFLGNR